ncbi:unnamed protein product, partial [Heterosigma akashiwo]
RTRTGQGTECLQRALKIADACLAASPMWRFFLRILDQYIYLFAHGCPQITDKFVSG